MGLYTVIVAAQEVRNGPILKLSPYPLTDIEVCFVDSSCPSPDLFYFQQCNLAVAHIPSQLVNSPLHGMALLGPSPLSSPQPTSPVSPFTWLRALSQPDQPSLASPTLGSLAL